MQKIVILTGAGISAESGLGTFRDVGGIWQRYRIEDVATPEAFARDADLVHGFYNARRVQAAEARPNAAHRALARLQAEHAGEVVIVTQNVDGLHEAGGARDVIHMHGELARALCAACGGRWEAAAQMSVRDACPDCGACVCRPDVVWFGEMPYHLDAIERAVAAATLFMAIGTSGAVYPAAGYLSYARAAGIPTIVQGLAEPDNLDPRDRFVQGRAAEAVSRLLDELLGA